MTIIWGHNLLKLCYNNISSADIRICFKWTTNTYKYTHKNPELYSCKGKHSFILTFTTSNSFLFNKIREKFIMIWSFFFLERIEFFFVRKLIKMFLLANDFFVDLEPAKYWKKSNTFDNYNFWFNWVDSSKTSNKQNSAAIKYIIRVCLLVCCDGHLT